MVWKGAGGGRLGYLEKESERRDLPRQRRNVSAKMICVSVCVRVRA